MIDKYMDVICAAVATAMAILLFLVCVILLIVIHEEITKKIEHGQPAIVQKNKTP